MFDPQPQVPTRKWARLLSRDGTTWFVLIASIAFTALAWHITKCRVEERGVLHFHTEVEHVRQHIAARMLAYEQILRGGVALFAAQHGAVDRNAWHRYVKTLRIDANFPGIQGVGFAQILRPDEIQAHIRRIRAEGFPDFTVFPQGRRPRYSSIVYLEPFDARNQRAFGFDMFSEPVRRAAMERAGTSGRTAISGRVTLVQEYRTDVQAGFLMYLPVYRPGRPLDTPAQRNDALLGFVYSPFRMGDLMRGILRGEPNYVAFKLYDGPTNSSHLIYRSPSETALRHPEFQQEITIDLPGRTWTALFSSRPSFEALVGSNQPLMIGIGGLVIDALLFVVIWTWARERRRVETRAAEMTSALRETATRLQLAHETASLGTWDRNLLAGSLIWNKRMFELYDMPAEAFDATDSCWHKAVHPDDLDRIIRDRESCLCDGRNRFTTTFRSIHRDGTVHFLESQATIMRDEGRPTRIIGVTRDVTERVQAEQALTAQHARLQAIIDGVGDGIILKDANLTYEAVNAFVAAFHGKPADAIIGKTDYDLFPRPEAELLRQHDLQVLTTGRTLVHEQRISSAKGLRWMEAVKAPLRAVDGSIQGVLVSARDITPLKNAQQALQREHAELEAVFSSTQAIIVVMDLQFTILRANAAFAATANSAIESLIGKNYFDVFRESRNKAIFEETVASGDSHSITGWPFSYPGRGMTYWDWTISALRDEHGAIDRLLLTAIDATERENRHQEVENAWHQANADLEKRVRERTRELEVTNHELESFSYSVAHDLRGPLRAINGFTHALEEDYHDLFSATARSYIARVQGATLRMGELIDGLLNLSRVLRTPITPATVNLTAIARETAQQLKTMEPDRCAEFVIEDGLVAKGDDTLLQLLIQNLLDNAWKFTTTREQSRICVGQQRKDGKLIFFVRDNGVGFDMAYSSKLFAPFERLHAPGEFDGNGIGLATARRIVQRHRGEIWAEGMPDSGATIYFTLEENVNGIEPLVRAG